MRLVALISVACSILVGCGSTQGHAPHRVPRESGGATAANRPVVLGSKDFIVWGGIGFGTAHPAKLVVGGDPSVMVTDIRWHNWGRWKASGVGWYAVPHYGRGGTYYRRHFRADLRVSGIGACDPKGPRTYMMLKVRVALQPGQRPNWYEAAGSHGLCRYP